MTKEERFQFGVCEWAMTLKGKGLAAAAASCGLNCLQLGVGREALEGKGLADPALVLAYKEGAKEYGLTIHSLSPQFVDDYSFTKPESLEEGLTAVAIVDETIRLSSAFGCKSFLLPVLGKNGITDGPSFHRAVSYIRHFAYKAAEAGMETWLELNLSVQKTMDLLEAVDMPGVRIFFDSQNLFALDGTSMARYFKTMYPYIGGVHVKDGIGGRLSGSLLGEGTSGFYRTVRAIVESPYKGCVLIESVYSNPEVSGLGSQEELLMRDAATLKRVFMNIDQEERYGQ